MERKEWKEKDGREGMGGEGWKTGLRICSIAHCSFPYLPICSDRSDQMSNCERFAQIAQDKRATVSKSLRSLMSKEQL